MLIKRHDQSDIVELADGSRWRIWPGDVATTLQWQPDTDIDVRASDEETCSHVLLDRSDGSQVRAIPASAQWPREHIRQSLKKA